VKKKADRIARNYYIDHGQHYSVSIKLVEKVVKRGVPLESISICDLFSCFTWDTHIASDIRNVQGSQLLYNKD
jgi:hypothetical protein